LPSRCRSIHRNHSCSLAWRLVPVKKAGRDASTARGELDGGTGVRRRAGRTIGTPSARVACAAAWRITVPPIATSRFEALTRISERYELAPGPDDPGETDGSRRGLRDRTDVGVLVDGRARHRRLVEGQPLVEKRPAADVIEPSLSFDL
jgi:hypothetical protein